MVEAHKWIENDVIGQFSPPDFLSWIASDKNIYFSPSSEVAKYANDIFSITGKLSFKAHAQDSNLLLAIKSGCEISGEGIAVEDSYDIKIIFTKNKFPIVCETDEKVKDIARKVSKKMADLHINSDGSCCLLEKIEQEFFLALNEPETRFIEEIVIPFFVRISIIGQNLLLPPGWGERGHGLIGTLESYNEHIENVSDDAFFRMHKDIISDLTQKENVNLLNDCYNNKGLINQSSRYYFNNTFIDVPVSLCQLLKKIRYRYKRLAQAHKLQP